MTWKIRAASPDDESFIRRTWRTEGGRKLEPRELEALGGHCDALFPLSRVLVARPVTYADGSPDDLTVVAWAAFSPSGDLLAAFTRKGFRKAGALRMLLDAGGWSGVIAWPLRPRRITPGVRYVPHAGWSLLRKVH